MLQLLSAYLKYMTKIGVLLGGEHNATEQQMYEVIEFEQTLANVSRRNILYAFPTLNVQEMDTYPVIPFSWC